MILVYILAIIHISICLQIKIQKKPLLSLEQIDDFNNLKMSINSNLQYYYPIGNDIFFIPQLSKGRHLLEIHSNYYLYPIVLIDQKDQDDLQMSLINPITRQIIKYLPHNQFIKIMPIDTLEYFEQQGSSTIMSFLFSGTGLILVFGVFMMLCYQKLMPQLQEAQLAPSQQS